MRHAIERRIIGELLEPEAQKDAHHWTATFGGHAWVALGPWGIIAITWDMWTAAAVVPVLYFVCWEGLQIILARQINRVMIWDSVLDTVAVTFGCYAATLLGNDYQYAAVICWGASVGVMATGWRVRT